MLAFELISYSAYYLKYRSKNRNFHQKLHTYIHTINYYTVRSNSESS